MFVQVFIYVYAYTSPSKLIIMLVWLQMFTWFYNENLECILFYISTLVLTNIYSSQLLLTMMKFMFTLSFTWKFYPFQLYHYIPMLFYHMYRMFFVFVFYYIYCIICHERVSINLNKDDTVLFLSADIVTIEGWWRHKFLTPRDNCSASTGKAISNLFVKYGFIHGHIHDRFCQNSLRSTNKMTHCYIRNTRK